MLGHWGSLDRVAKKSREKWKKDISGSLEMPSVLEAYEQSLARIMEVPPKRKRDDGNVNTILLHSWRLQVR